MVDVWVRRVKLFGVCVHVRMMVRVTVIARVRVMMRHTVGQGCMLGCG
jgi:hypothetical protein